MPSLPKMFDRQLEVANLIVKAKRGTRTIIGYGGAMSGGKGLDVSTPIPTPSGWVTMGDLRVGDYVFGPDGAPTKVLFVSDIHNRPCYRVTLDDGAQLIADDQHKWVVWDHNLRASRSKRTDKYRQARQSSRPLRVSGNRTASQSAAIAERNRLIKRFAPPVKPITVSTPEMKWLVDNARAGDSITIDRAAALQYGERELPLAPYLFGMWLGDGTSSAAAQTCGVGDIAQVKSEWEAAGFTISHRGGGITFGIGGVQSTLRKMGVLNNKHIPRTYLESSVNQRLELLKGLMDTDGTCGTAGSVEFTTTNPVLASDFEELVRSLGWRANKREGRATLNGKDCGPVWDIKWTPDVPVFKLERKASRQRIGGARTRNRKVVSVEPVDSVPTVCIMVDHESHCFVAGRGLVTTHNTSLIAMLAIQYAFEFPGANIVIARKDIVSLRPTTMARFYQYCPTHLEDGTQVLFNRDDNNKNLCRIRLPNWPRGVYSTVYFRGLADPDFFFSLEATAIFVDECAQIPEYSILVALTRLRQQLPDGSLPKWLFVAATNPGASWFDDWFLDPDSEKIRKLKEYSEDNEAAIGTIDFVFSGPSDNPHTDDNYTDFMSAILTDEMREMYVEGDFGSYEGKVFTNFIPDNLVLTQDDIKKAWRDEELDYIDVGTRKLYIPKFQYAIGGLDFAGEQRSAHPSTAGVRIVLPAHRKDGAARDIAIDDWAGKGPNVFLRQREYMKKMEYALHRKIDWVADKTQPAGIQALRDYGFTIHENEGGNDSWLHYVGVIKGRFELDERGLPQSFYLSHLHEWEKEMQRYHLDPKPNTHGETKEKPVRVGDDRVDWYRYSTEYMTKLLRRGRRKVDIPHGYDRRPKGNGMTMGDFIALSKMLTKKVS